MARKKRIHNEPPTPVEETKEVVAYQDAFQQKVNKHLEDAETKLQGKGKTILYGLLGLIAVIAIFFIVSSLLKKSDQKAQAALGKAIQTSQAVVTASPLPAGSTEKSFKTEKERAEASIAEFDAVAANYSGDVAAKAKYLSAVNKLSVDRPAAITALEASSKAGGEIGNLAKFALAQAYATDGKNDEAIALYKDLAGQANPVVAKSTVNFALAELLEKTGKNDEAVEAYFNIAKTAAEAKDLDGKAIPLSETGRKAKERVQKLNPEKAKEIPEPTPEPPSGT